MSQSTNPALPYFGLLIIGDEILSGRREDRHFTKVRDLLAARGARLTWSMVLADDPERITSVLRQSFASGDVVFSCGGIGATPDDHTRQCAGRALGRPLVLHPEARRLIQLRIVQAHLGDLDSATNLHRLKMGEFPEGSDIIPNPYNQIPGFAVQRHYFVPGFPEMAWPMIEWVLDTHYPQLRTQAAGWLERALILSGAAESDFTPLMERLEAEFNGIRVFSLPMLNHPRWGRCLELGVKGPDSAMVQAAYDTLRRELPTFGAQVCTEVEQSDTKSTK